MMLLSCSKCRKRNGLCQEFVSVERGRPEFILLEVLKSEPQVPWGSHHFPRINTDSATDGFSLFVVGKTEVPKFACYLVQ